MKKCFLLWVACTICLAINASVGKYRINVEVNPKIMNGAGDKNVALLVSTDQGVRKVAKCPLIDGKASFEGETAADSLAYLQFGDEDKFRISFVLEPGDIIIDQKDNMVQAHGTPLNERLSDFYSDESVSWKDSAAFVRKNEQFIAQNRDNSLSALLFLSSMYVRENVLDVTELYWKALSPRIQQNGEVAALYQRVVANAKCHEGMMFKDAQLVEGKADGKKVRLADYIGKGKYVLIDLWASWCTACRLGIPNVKAAYATYKNKGLECVSVTVWDKRDRALRAIKEEAMPWTQLMDETGVLGKAYGFNSIPRLYLFSPDGHLLRKDIPNDQLLKVLQDILGNE